MDHCTLHYVADRGAGVASLIRRAVLAILSSAINAVGTLANIRTRAIELRRATGAGPAGIRLPPDLVFGIVRKKKKAHARSNLRRRDLRYLLDACMDDE
jgi:hypothetical protein